MMLFRKERIEEIIRQLKERIYESSLDIGEWKGMDGHFPILDEVHRTFSDWERVDPAVLGAGSSKWFGLACEFMIPEEMDGYPVEMRISTGREGEWDATNPQMAAYVNGKLVQGLDVNHRSIRISNDAKAKESYTVFLSVYTGETGNILKWTSCLQALNTEVKELYYDLLVAWQCLYLMEEESREYELVLQLLNETVNLLDFRNVGRAAFLDSVKTAKQYWEEKRKSLPGTDIVVSCVGHTHIDVAWLWTLGVTKEKAARSFSSVLQLMEDYPEYIFMSSQPQLYKYVQQYQPGLYMRIKEKAAKGRWEPEGAMFLEADCNLTNGESLVRQILYGKQFFYEEFAADNKILWLPDVFGYSASLPQIMKKTGIESFMTTKISWNETNMIPYDTFWWEGIDGTKILTHFITTRDYSNNGKLIVTGNEFTTAISTNYNGCIHPSQIKGAWQRYQQKGLNNNILVSFGYGDGGGGPTEEMLETARRLKDGLYSCPKVRIEKAGAYFDRLHQTAKRNQFPTWSGELYLEYHRGTYTSMAMSKRANRKGEFALLNAELWALLTEQFSKTPDFLNPCAQDIEDQQTSREYPAKQLLAGWELLMRNQFHDILPGSSIGEVYKESAKEYEELFQITDTIIKESVDYLAEQSAAQEGEYVVFNANGLRQDGIVVIEEKEENYGQIQAVSFGDEILPVQWQDDHTMIFYAKDVPAKGWKTYTPIYKEFQTAFSHNGNAQEIAKTVFICKEDLTETPWHRIMWNEKGQIISFYDKTACRELLEKGKCGNVLMTYEDKPHKFDNWNIYEYYKEKSWEIDQLLSREVVECGPVRMVMKFLWKYLKSTICQYVCFYKDTARIDFKTYIDWQEDQILLKTHFPFMLNANEATYEIQYGHVKRSTKRNTSWEQAQFEVCHQKWLDVGEYDYGVSLMNDCKYGVSTEGAEIGLTLLKSGMYPNPEADRGLHEFCYAIYPHQKSWQAAGTICQAYQMNNPFIGRKKGTSRGTLPIYFEKVKISAKNIILETAKKSEQGNAQILRFYESFNSRTEVTLEFPETCKEIALCDMMENTEYILAEHKDRCCLTFEPFEIVTLKIMCE